MFLSHRFAEQAEADRLAAQLRPRWTVVTHAVTPEAATTWQRDCRPLIGRADAVVCIVGDRTAESTNIDWEIETALARGVPVIAVRSPEAIAPALPAPLAARGSRLLETIELPTRLDEVALERAG